MGLQPEGPPNATDGRLTQPCFFRQSTGTPMSCCLGGRFQSQLHYPFHVLIPDFARGSGARLIKQTIHSTSDEPLSPKSHRKTGGLQLPGNSDVVLAAGTLLNNLGAERDGG